MRVCFFMQDRGRLYGAEKAVINLASALLAEGSIDPSVLLIEETRVPERGGDFERGLRERGVEVQSVPVGHAFSRSLMRNLGPYVRERGVDLLHTIGPKATVHAAWAQRRLGIPMVSTLHGWLFRKDFKERLHEALERRAFRSFNSVIVLSRFYEDLLGQVVGREKVVRIPIGLPPESIVEEDRAAARDYEEEPFVVGLLGRFSSEKNHEMLVRAAALLKDRGVAVQFRLAGEGPLRETIRGLVQRQGMDELFVFSEYEEPMLFMERIHALASCSRVENLPYNIMEAMAWGRPIVATRVGGVPDLVKDGSTGYLVDPDDAGTMADRLQRLSREPVLAKRMGATGREKLLREFDFAKGVAAHVQLYRNVALTGGG